MGWFSVKRLGLGFHFKWFVGGWSISRREVAGLLGVHGRFIGERGSGVDREYGGVIGECHVSREMGDHERIVLMNVLIEDF